MTPHRKSDLESLHRKLDKLIGWLEDFTQLAESDEYNDAMDQAINELGNAYNHIARALAETELEPVGEAPF